jgi:zinc protease
VELLADLIQHPAFTAEETDRLRKARATSLLQDTDQPLRLAALDELRALYGADNPYGYNLLGTESSLAAITPSDLESFWKAHYGPSDTALILAGDLTTADAHTLAETYFGKWASSATATQPPPTPPAVTRKIILIGQPGAPQTALIATSIGVPRSNPDYMPLQVVNNMLGGLFSSRISMNLREVHGYTYGAGSRFDYRRGAGPFFARSSVRTDVTAPALHELVGELERIRTEPLTADELKRSKDDLMQALPGDFETADDVASQLGQLFLYNLPLDYYRTYPLSVAAVTAEQAAAAADKYIHPEQMVLIGVVDVAKIRPEIEKLNLGPVVEWNPKLEPVAGR